MLAAYDQVPTERRFGRRAVALAVVVGVHLLLALLLYFIAPRLRLPPSELPPILVTLLPSPAPTPEASPRPSPKASPKVAAKAAAKAPPKAKPKRLEDFKLPIIKLSKSDLAASDIASIPSVSTTQSADNGSGKGETGAGDSEFAEGGAPGGERLYKAEWYRRPTHAELAGYLPRGVPEGGWGVIACKTIDRYMVEDCQELGESPRGSGISRALRQAAWQFRVRPPRLGGKDLFGVWVSIRIDFSENAPG